MLVGALTFSTPLWFHSPYTSQQQSINQSIIIIIIDFNESFEHSNKAQNA